MVFIEFLKQAGVSISDELRDDLNSSLTLTQYGKGDSFCKQEHVCRQLGFLIQGQAVLHYNADGTEYTRWVGLQYTFVTSFGSFINEVASIYGISFITDATMEVISKTDFDRLAKKHAEMQLFILKAVSQDLLKYQHLTDLLITAKGKERYVKFQERYPQIVSEVPQKYIASILGMNPRHLSRIRKQLAEGDK